MCFPNPSNRNKSIRLRFRYDISLYGPTFRPTRSSVKKFDENRAPLLEILTSTEKEEIFLFVLTVEFIYLSLIHI